MKKCFENYKYILFDKLNRNNTHHHIEIMDKWRGKVAVVTGATRGIGTAIVTELVMNGMMVCGLGRRKDKIEVRMRII